MSADPPPENPPPRSAGTAPGDFAGSVLGDARPAGSSRPGVPHAIERRYLRVDDHYFFPDRTLAFIDDGGRIRVRSENREVLHSVVAISEARGWRVIELKGTETFRQGMWREAALRGIEAHGYEPTPAEILQVQRALQRWQASHETNPGPGSQTMTPERKAPTTHEGTTPIRPDQHGGGHPPEAPQGGRSLRDGPRPPVRGILVAAAAAPYQFDPAQRMSFYLVVRTEVGDRTIWGTDLERALAESASQPRIGDPVVLTQHGTRPVKVRVPARNAEGELVGEKNIVAQRARWSVETPDHHQTMERRAELVRNGDVVSEVAWGRHPELAMAAAGLKLAEQYARHVTTDPASQQRLVQLIRERMALALEQGRSIHLPDRRMRPAPVPVKARRRPAREPEEMSHERF